MKRIVGVRFKEAGKLYYFSPKGLEIKRNEMVMVETARGLEMGEVLVPARDVEDSEVVAPLKDVLRIASEKDLATAQENRTLEREAHDICQKKIVERGLSMKLVDVEYTFDRSKVLFYFTADGRVDFRELVKDLAAQLKTRIELRQIGVRDEAKLLGGLGCCGRPVCCKSFLGEFQPVSIKMAKEQNLSLSPTKISGLCGRLMCCLKYEQDTYECLRKQMPKVGKDIMTPDGIGFVIENNVIAEKSRVRLQLDDGTTDMREYRFSEMTKPTQEETEKHKNRQVEAANARAERDAAKAARAERAAAKRRPAAPKPQKQPNIEAFERAEAAEQADRTQRQQRDNRRRRDAQPDKAAQQPGEAEQSHQAQPAREGGEASAQQGGRHKPRPQGQRRRRGSRGGGGGNGANSNANPAPKDGDKG